MKRSLPRRVYLKHGAFYYVDTANKWHRLCSEQDGLPAVYGALAKLTAREATSDRMPAVISRWLDSKRAEWVEKTERDQERIARVMADSFVEFRPEQVTTPVCSQYLKRFAATKRTHNLHRSMLRQVLAFAALEGLREGHNPVDNIATKSVPGRKRTVSDDEITAIKAGAMKQSRNGEALVQMIDLALLTGQRISDLIGLRWQDVTKEGIRVQQDKTGERLLIEWSPKLRAAIAACARGGDRIGFVLQTQSGRGYKYSGIRSAWVRACARAGVDDLNIHDMRGRAGVDKRDGSNLEGAKNLLGHRSIKMTEHYIDGKSTRKVKPAG
jgi:integrase